MFRNYLRQATFAALALGATLLSGAAQAQVTYNYTFPQVPANIVATLSGSTAPVGGGPLYHPPLIRYNDDAAVSVLPATLLTSTIGQTLTPYRFTNFVVTSAGLYSVTLSGTLTDVTAAQAGIYQNSFDPANPLKNNVALIPGATTGTASSKLISRREITFLSSTASIMARPGRSPPP